MTTGYSVNREKTAKLGDTLRLDPELRLCSEWDATSIRKFRLASRDQMGFRVLDDFVHEHIQ